MPRFTYNASVTDRSGELTWEVWLEQISDAEATKVAAIAQLPGSGEIPTQGAYDALLRASQNYYKKVK